jgi:hypothetical protein
MPLMYRKHTLGVKTEATYGTAETITASEALRVNDLTMKLAADVVNREKSTGLLGTDVGIPKNRIIELKFNNYAHGDGGSGDPAWAAALFPSVGMAQSSSTYATTSTTTGWKGMTAAINRDGRRLIGRGFMGNHRQMWKSGEPVKFEWDFIGATNAAPPILTDTAQLANVTFESTVPPIFAGSGALTIASQTFYKISTAELDLNNGHFAREDPSAVGGYIGGWLNNPSPTLTIDAEAVLVATKDWGTAFHTAAEVTIVLVAGATSGNIITTTCTSCQLKNFPEEVDRNNLLVDQLVFQVNGTVTTVFS